MFWNRRRHQTPHNMISTHPTSQAFRTVVSRDRPAKGKVRVVFGDLMLCCRCKCQLSNEAPKTLTASILGTKGGFEAYSRRRFFLVKNVKSTFAPLTPKIDDFGLKLPPFSPLAGPSRHLRCRRIRVSHRFWATSKSDPPDRLPLSGRTWCPPD